MNTLKYLIPLITSAILVGCGGSATAVTPEPDKAKMPDAMTPVDKVTPVVKEAETTTPVLTLSFTPTKAFHFSWVKVTGATSYKIREDINSDGDYQDITTTTVAARSFDHIVPLYARVNARYILQSCIEDDCTKTSEAVFTMPVVANMADSIGYFKASNTGAGDNFGSSVSLSEDGSTLAVGAHGEDSNSQAINTGQDDDKAINAGAVYVFTRSGAVWEQEAYLKAGNAGGNDYFGESVSLSADGNTLAVGANGERSNAKGINGTTSDRVNDALAGAGAAYVFLRNGAGWSQQAYVKATNTGVGDQFGSSVSLSADGSTLAVSSPNEKSEAKWVNGTNPDQTINGAIFSGAVYVFIRDDITWSQQAYLKASNTDAEDYFGSSVSLSANGNTLAVGASDESSNATGRNGDETDNSAADAGAVYVFIRDDLVWTKQAYLKASNAGAGDEFGYTVSLSADGNTLAVGAHYEDSDTTGIGAGASETNENAFNSGAAYVFTRDASLVWAQQAYLKANNTDSVDRFGHSVSLGNDGNTLAVGAYYESSNAIGIINGVSSNNSFGESGAAYTYARSAAGTWSLQAYIKASITGGTDEFGSSVALSADGDTLAVGATEEDSNAIGVNADKDNNDVRNAGAVYVY